MSPTLLAAAKCVWMIRKLGWLSPLPSALEKLPSPASTMKAEGKAVVAISSANPTVANPTAIMRHRRGSSSNTPPSRPPTWKGGLHFQEGSLNPQSFI